MPRSQRLTAASLASFPLLLYARRHDVRARSPRDVPFQDPAPVPARRRARPDARARRRGEGAGPAGGANGGAGFVQPLRLQRPRRPEGLLQGVHGVHRPRRAGRSSRDSKVSNFPTLPMHLLASSAPSPETPRADTTRRFPLWRRISWTSRAIHEDHHALHNQTQILTPPRTFFPSKVLRDSQRVQAVHQMQRRRRSVRRVHP